MTPVVLLWDCMAEALMRWPWREKERERKKVQLPGQMFKNKGKPQLLIRRNSRQAKEIKYHFLIFGNNPGFLIHLLHLDIIAAEREWDRKKQRLTYFFFFNTCWWWTRSSCGVGFFFFYPWTGVFRLALTASTGCSSLHTGYTNTWTAFVSGFVYNIPGQSGRLVSNI